MQQNNQNNKKFKKSYFGVIIITILLLVGVYFMISNSVSKPDKLTATDFWEYLEDDKIKTIEITPMEGDNNSKSVVTGKYIDENGEEKRYSITLYEKDIQEKITSNK